MDPTVAVNLGLALLNQVLTFIREIKGQGGLTDDQILAEAQKITAGNDAAYAQLKAQLIAAGAVAPSSS